LILNILRVTSLRSITIAKQRYASYTINDISAPSFFWFQSRRIRNNTETKR